jgi:hypothetical protein
MDVRMQTVDAPRVAEDPQPLVELEGFMEKVLVALRVVVVYCTGCGVRAQHEAKHVGYVFSCRSCRQGYRLAAVRADLDLEDQEHNALLAHLKRAQEEFLTGRAAGPTLPG